jgi:hypothetical protein
MDMRFLSFGILGIWVFELCSLRMMLSYSQIVFFTATCLNPSTSEGLLHGFAMDGAEELRRKLATYCLPPVRFSPIDTQ